jgi:hypothetical protein
MFQANEIIALIVTETKADVCLAARISKAAVRAEIGRVGLSLSTMTTR